MTFNNKVLYSIVPTIILASVGVHLYVPGGIFQMWHFIVLNLLFVIHNIMLYKEQGKQGIAVANKILYTILLFLILPFHYILVWGILKSK